MTTIRTPLTLVEVFRISATRSLLAESLRAPNIEVRASRHSPNPNPVRRQAFAQVYPDADRPAVAAVGSYDRRMPLHNPMPTAKP